jgi:hypothetical protein
MPRAFGKGINAALPSPQCDLKTGPPPGRQQSSYFFVGTTVMTPPLRDTVAECEKQEKNIAFVHVKVR